MSKHQVLNCLVQYICQKVKLQMKYEILPHMVLYKLHTAA